MPAAEDAVGRLRQPEATVLQRVGVHTMRKQEHELIGPADARVLHPVYPLRQDTQPS
jgi:hypothetical protein